MTLYKRLALCFFIFSNTAFAIDQGYTPGRFWRVESSTFHYHQTDQGACDIWVDWLNTNPGAGPEQTASVVWFGSSGYCQGSNGSTGPLKNYSCSGYEDQSFCQPIPPADCSEASQQHDSSNSFTTLSDYSAEFCFDGCRANPIVMSKDPVTGEWSGNFSITSSECNGGYQQGLGSQEIIDFYAHDAELQNCYDSTGRLIGQISTVLTCPDLDVCYDSATGDYIGTTSSSTSCTDGVKYTQLDDALKDLSETVSSSESTTVNPDGTSTTVKETEESQTGLDGSTVTNNTTTTINKDSQGNTTSEDTTTAETTKNEEDNYAVKYPPSCSNPELFRCSGDLLQCEQLKQQWLANCSSDQITESEVETQLADSDFINKYGADRDSNGVLSVLNKGEVNAATTLGLSSLGDNGAAGSCPSPRPINMSLYNQTFDWQPICDYATTIRPLVILSALAMAGFLVGRSLLG